MEDKLLTFENLKPGIQQVTLNVNALYPKEEQREQFKSKLSEFLSSASVHSRIFDWTGDTVVYRTECIIPAKRDRRPPLLLVFGNPASSSIDSEMFFSSEGNGREHRLWKILSRTDILSFSPTARGCSSNEVNQLRKRELYELSCHSAFRIGLDVYYTMPSPASKRPWAGVAGLHRLFGKEALAMIGQHERSRLAQTVRDFVSPNGAVIAFQKDAYMALKSSTSPDYSIDRARGGDLIGSCQCDPCISLFCLPPTRLLYKETALLREFRKRILEADEESL